MVTEYLLSLPSWLIVKETATNPRVQFDLKIFKNHSRELRLCYETYNETQIIIPWDKESNPRSWILLYENISDDTDFIEAVQYVLNEILALSEYIENPFKFSTTTS